MKTKIIILLAALALAGCSTYQGGTGSGSDTDEGTYPTDFGRGGNRANPSPFDTQSGAILPETDNMDLHGMESGKFPPSHH
jgi:predicted small secreted protein